MDNLLESTFINRCENHRCKKRTNCKRYLQLEIDKLNAIQDASTVRIDEDICHIQIKVTQ